jgi:hypothetical protein
MKSKLHRRILGGSGYQANCRGLLRPWKLKYKAQGTRHFMQTEAALATAELAQIADDERQVRITSAMDRETEAENMRLDIEAQRYLAWAGKAEWPAERPYYYWLNDYPDSLSTDPFDSHYGDSHYGDSRDESEWWELPIVYTCGRYTLTQWNTDVYHLSCGFHFVGSVRLTEKLIWHVDFVPERGAQTHNEFEFLDTSIEAATHLLIVMHRMDESRTFYESD